MEQNTVVALGDSITYGYPFSPQESWVEILREKTGWKVINAGISGDTLEDMARRLDRDVLAHKPRVAIVMGGTNDVFAGMSQSRMEQSFMSIYEGLREKGIKTWLGLPLPVDDPCERKLSRWRDWLNKFGQREKLIVVDFYQDFISAAGQIRSELLSDECHPTLQGYKVMGQRIIKVVNTETI